MEFILKYRFNYLDLCIMGLVGVLMGRGFYLFAIILMVIMGLLVILIEINFGEQAKKKMQDKQWQNHVHADRYVDALRAYRSIYNCGLKEAVDVVKEYQTRMGK